MPTRRVITVLLGLALAGMPLGALAGAIALDALVFAISIREGQFDMSQWRFGAILGAFIGGACGAVLAPLATLPPWRHVPIGRLFAHLTLGAVVGGSAAALLFPAPAFALVGGILGFLVAGDRLAFPKSGAARTSEPRPPAD